MDEFVRTEMLLGKEAMQKLEAATVAVFGVGGVGSYAAEALARSGVGGFVLFDSDTVDVTNINRQIIATQKTVGKQKTDVMKKRIHSINPQANVKTYSVFYSEQNAGQFDLSGYSYILDAIDTVSSKLTLIEQAHAAGVPIISSMGAGNKLDPTRFEVADLYKTSVCPLAKVMRRELKKRGITTLKVVYSTEEPLKPYTQASENPDSLRKSTPGSVAFVPSVAGLVMAGEVVKGISGLV
ncbi:tRNA threonylcarbamoyladenosine dehydratase [Christensenellaceae bacterium OttesenSCG-928-K19]|nr:tRNA threonylcarbamoyladenosine dehydratase [Christensenellaceae bacterium OttesenSCG-928-K19]